MQLVIDSYGSYIHRKENLFIVESKVEGQEDKNKEEFCADSISQILISSGASVSSNAIELASEKHIDIVYLDWSGTPYARTYPCKLGGTTRTRRMQATKYLSKEVAEMIKTIVKAKSTNQLNLLKGLAKTHQAINFQEDLDLIKENMKKLDSLEGNLDKIRSQLLGIEGYCSYKYWSCLARTRILPYKGREQNAKDIVNAMLNYGYGILYSEVEKACIIAGLDPYLGFLHTDRYGKPSTVLDLIEEFRQPIVDRAIINLFSRNQVEETDGETSGNLFLLTKNGKKKVIDSVMEKLHSQIQHKNTKSTMQSMILIQARQVVGILLGEKAEYYPFINAG